jgi:hypothetical protein
MKFLILEGFKCQTNNCINHLALFQISGSSIFKTIFMIVYKYCCSVCFCVVGSNFTLLTLFSKFYIAHFYLEVDRFEFHGIVRQGAHLNLVQLVSWLVTHAGSVVCEPSRVRGGVSLGSAVSGQFRVLVI